MNNKEIWKEIEGFDGKYSVSNYGRIRLNNYEYKSLCNITYKYKEKIIEPFTWQSRYLRIDLQLNRNNNKNRLSTYVHKLVAEYFIGPRPDGYQIDHIDGNYLNNKADNLRYVTRKENMNNPNTILKQKNKRMSEEAKKKISEKLKGKPQPWNSYKRSDEVRKRISEAAKNRKYSEEGRKKLSKCKSGCKNPFYGKQHSEETKKRMSDSHKGKHRVYREDGTYYMSKDSFWE